MTSRDATREERMDITIRALRIIANGEAPYSRLPAEVKATCGNAADYLETLPSAEAVASRDEIIEECARAVIDARVLWDDDLPSVGDRMADAIIQVAEQVRRLKNAAPRAPGSAGVGSDPALPAVAAPVTPSTAECTSLIALLKRARFYVMDAGSDEDPEARRLAIELEADIDATLRGAPSSKEPLTDSFVQTVPDKCDRIVWRNRYYHLPIAQSATATKSDIRCPVCGWVCEEADREES